MPKVVYETLLLNFEVRPRILYPAALSFESSIKVSTDSLNHERNHTP